MNDDSVLVSNGVVILTTCVCVRMRTCAHARLRRGFVSRDVKKYAVKIWGYVRTSETKAGNKFDLCNVDPKAQASFLDVIIRQVAASTSQVYKSPTHSDLNFESSHPSHVKRTVVQSLYNRATAIFQE